MSPRVISRRRARFSGTMISANSTSEDASESRAAQSTTVTLSLPTELIYNILAISIGDYISDMMLLPCKILKWDAIMTFLHVSRAFRGCTIRLLYHLWGETFIRERTSVIENYKPTLNVFRQLSRQAHYAPHSFTCEATPPRLLSARVVRHPITPLARIWSALIRNTAAASAMLEDAEGDWRYVDFEDVYSEKDLEMIMKSYAEIPAGIRPLLQGRVMHQVMTQAAFWTKMKELRAVVCTIIRIFLQLDYMDDSEIIVELPKMTEDLIVQSSQEMHADYADAFSIAVEDIPPLLPNHIAAVGLNKVLPLIKLAEDCEEEGGMFADFYRMMRSHVASNLTENERVQYLK